MVVLGKKFAIFTNRQTWTNPKIWHLTVYNKRHPTFWKHFFCSELGNTFSIWMVLFSKTYFSFEVKELIPSPIHCLIGVYHVFECLPYLKSCNCKANKFLYITYGHFKQLLKSSTACLIFYYFSILWNPFKM